MSLFSFDPVGNLAANRIQNELQTITLVNGVDHNYLVPENAPFYDESVLVVDKDSGLTLIKDIDYFFTYAFLEASSNTGKPISGGVVFIDPNRSGNYSLNYQTLGGEYVNEETRAIEDGLSALEGLDSVDWSNLVNVPNNFPPTPHNQSISSIDGVVEILNRFTAIEAAIRSPERHITLSDISDLNTGYVAPMTEGMAGISAAIEALVGASNIHHLEAHTGTTDVYLTPGDVDVWILVPLSLTIFFTGTYSLSLSGNPEVIMAGLGNPCQPALRDPNYYGHYDLRFTVNGEHISQSPILTTIVGLSVDDVVGVELRVRGSQAQSIKVAGPAVACGLSLIRIGQ